MALIEKPPNLDKIGLSIFLEGKSGYTILKALTKQNTSSMPWMGC
jgi:hypothetical protein